MLSVTYFYWLNPDGMLFAYNYVIDDHREHMEYKCLGELDANNILTPFKQAGSSMFDEQWLELNEDDFGALPQEVKQKMSDHFFGPMMEAFSDDAVAKLVYETLLQRGHDPLAAKRAMKEKYDYDPFGRIVDEIEDSIKD